MKALKEAPKRMVELVCRMLCTNSRDRIKINEISGLLEKWIRD